MNNFIKKEFLMIVATFLLALPMFTMLNQEVYTIIRVVLWLIFWFYIFKSYQTDKKWMMLFALPVLLYNPFYILNYTNEVWGILNGLFFVLSASWLLKSFKLENIQKV